MSTHALELTDVTKSFGDFTAVQDFGLTVDPGELIGFLGPNGAGKTTTIRMIMNIFSPDSGSIQVLGEPVGSGIKDRIGYLPEERGLYSKMTVDATLRYFGKLKGLSDPFLRDRIADLLDDIGLPEWRNKKLDALSKGMRQKIQFLTTVIHEPELVILDEPFSGLDPLNREVLTDLIRKLRERGTTVVFSTHVMEQAERLCDRLVLINRGRKLIDGTLPEIRSRFSRNKVLIEGSGDFSSLRSRADVIKADITSGGAELDLTSDADPQQILRGLVDQASITRFEINQPDLQEIFVRLVEEDTGKPPEETLERDYAGTSQEEEVARG